MYVAEPGQSVLVETNPDPVGLKVGVIYDVDVTKREFLLHRFAKCSYIDIKALVEIVTFDSFDSKGFSVNEMGR